MTDLEKSFMEMTNNLNLAIAELEEARREQDELYEQSRLNLARSLEANKPLQEMLIELRKFIFS